MPCGEGPGNGNKHLTQSCVQPTQPTCSYSHALRNLLSLNLSKIVKSTSISREINTHTNKEVQKQSNTSQHEPVQWWGSNVPKVKIHVYSSTLLHTKEAIIHDPSTRLLRTVFFHMRICDWNDFFEMSLSPNESKIAAVYYYWNFVVWNGVQRLQNVNFEPLVQSEPFI